MLDIALWIAQGFLALFFLAAGLPKLLGRGIDRWVGFDDIARPLTVVIGVAEVAGAVALAVPPLIGVLEWISPLAAIGIAVISLMAAGFHVRASEGLAAAETVLWACLAGVVAVGRGEEIGNGPVPAAGALVVAIVVLVPAIVVNLVVLARRPVAPRNAGGSPQRAASAH